MSMCNSPVPGDDSVTRDAVLDTAKQLISGDRDDVYGSPAENFSRAATLWSAVLGIDVTPEQYALCMILTKVSRLHNTIGHIDSWVDMAGYAALGAEVAALPPEARK